jgi:hypothetical protein
MHWKNILQSINLVLSKANLTTLNIIIDNDGYLIKHHILTKNLNMLLPLVDESRIDELYYYIYAEHKLLTPLKTQKIKIARIITTLTTSLPNKF